LRAARLFSVAAYFWLKIASFGRGTLAGTRKHEDQPEKTNTEKINTAAKGE
jgi:hypothetical protein